MENVKERVIDALERVGITYPFNGEEINSIVFITGIVELEQEFDIEIPDQFLTLDFLYSIENIESIVIDLINSKPELKG